MSKARPRTATAAKATAALDPEAYYRVLASERFEFRRISFGTTVATEVRGALLSEVLGGEHAGKVLSFDPVNA